MAIPGQQQINIGLPNDPANSDSLYTAFNAIQNNFTTLFDTASSITRILPGSGINVVNNTSNSVIITNTGVTQLIAGNNITITPVGNNLSNSTGALIINSTSNGGSGGGNGTVTSVGVFSNTLAVSGSPITESGTIFINLVDVNISNAGSYSNPIVSVDKQGRIRSISNGSSGITSIAVTGNTGISVTGSPITSAGVIDIKNTGVTSIKAGTNISINRSNGEVTISASGGGNGGGGTVTSIGISSNNLVVSNSPIVSAGDITVDIPNNLSLNSFTGNSGNFKTLRSSRIDVIRSDTNDGIIVASTSDSTLASAITVESARGNATTPAPVFAGDQLLRVRAKGYTSLGTYQAAGGMIVRAVGNGGYLQPGQTTNDFVPSRISLFSTASDNSTKTLTLDENGNLFAPGRITSTLFSNAASNATFVSARARGNSSSNISIVNVNDDTLRLVSEGYTGNGLNTIEGVTGWSFSSSIESKVTGLPEAAGAYLPSEIRITTVSNSNALNRFTFSDSGNLNVPRTVSAGNLQVSGLSQLGDVTNVKITGGNDGQFLRTDGRGNLFWVSGGGGGNAIPPMYFTAPITSNNQQFSNTYLSSYSSNSQITLFRNGALLEYGFYTLSGNTITITTEINAGDSISIIAQSGAGGGTSDFTNLTATGNVDFGNSVSVNLGNINRLSISGGSLGDVLTSQGNGVVSWQSAITNSYDFGVIGQTVTNPVGLLLQMSNCDFGTMAEPSSIVLDLGTF